MQSRGPNSHVLCVILTRIAICSLCSLFPYTTLFRSTIGVTVTIEHPQTLEVAAAQTPAHEGNVWRYERLFMPGDHISIRWKPRSEEHTSELQSRRDLVCRLLHEKKK